jgi:hypothetical protein
MLQQPDPGSTDASRSALEQILGVGVSRFPAICSSNLVECYDDEKLGNLQKST